MDLERHPLDEEAPPSVVINPHSELGKELRRWEQHVTHLVPPGTKPGNPYVYRPYPRMLYKARQRPNGQWACLMPTPHPYAFTRPEEYQRAELEKEAFDRSCQRIVHSEGEELVAKGQGWCEDPVAALAQAEAEQRAIGQAAAEANFAAQRMSDKARQELDAANEATHEHVVDVVPKRKRGRPAKGVTAVTT